MLRRNKHPHPLIYMRGVKSEDLVAIVDFLYYGEANVFQENIDSFLSIAEELDLKGLTGNSDNSGQVEENIVKPEPKRNHKQSISAFLKVENLPIQDKRRGLDDVQNHTVSNPSDIQELDDLVKSMMTKSQSNYQNGMRKNYICTVCGKEGKGNAIKDHIEANHLEGVSLPCGFCEKTFRSRAGLRQHIMRVHS